MNQTIDDILETSVQKSTNKIIELADEKPDNQWKMNKKLAREELSNMADLATVNAVANSDSFKKYLDFQSHFNQYSVQNTLLIMAQNPKATKLADHDKWVEQGANVKRGQKGISILEPKGEYTGSDGEKRTNFVIKKLFDITQTTAIIESNPQVTLDEKLFLHALVSHAPAKLVSAENMRDHILAYYNPDTKQIFAQRGLEPSKAVYAIIEEIAHSYLDDGISYDRVNFRFAAHAVAYIVCRQNGIDVSGFNFEISSTDIEPSPLEFRKDFELLRSTANKIRNDMQKDLNPPKKQVPKIDEQER